MEDLIVVGNGMAGVACLEQILKHSPKFHITVFGDETHVNYNRILLSSRAGRRALRRRHHDQPLAWYQQNHVALRLGVRIVDVDPKRRTITGDDGSTTHYDKLLLATGIHRLDSARSTASTRKTSSPSAISTTRAASCTPPARACAPS